MIDDDFSMISLFNFPYEPYPEQGKLMAAIHECIESSSVGCFESPTGTGKSLSAICASFYWLLQEEKRIKDKIAQANSIMSATVPEDDWMADFCSSKVATESVTSGGDPVSLLAQHNAMLQRVARSKTQRSQLQKANSRRQSTAETASTIAAGETDEFALKNYDSEEERNNVKARIYASGSEDSDSDNSISANSSGAKPREKSSSRGKRKKNAAELLQMPQIFYCSRTHSQLAQFVAEMNKTPHAKQDPITGIVPIRCVTLGSRKNMCINSAVTRLKSESSMSEACLEMQKPSSRTVAPSNTQKTPTIGSKKMKLRGVRATCEFHSRTSERHLADRALSQVQDIEDVVTLAHDTSACPYYASRRAVQDANVVCLPYSMLLNKEMRDSLGLTVAGKVIIIDEAHNLIETINQLHSAELSVTQIDCASGAISAYLRRYQSQLSAKNLYYINILSAVLGKLRKVLCPKVAKAKTTTLVAEDASASAGVAFGTSNAKPAAAESGLTVNDFLFKSSLDGINLFKLKRHIEETNLVQKIGGYAESLALKEAASSGTAPAQHTAVGSSKNACGAAAKATVGNTSQERFQQGKSSNGATGNDSRGGAGGVSVRADVVAALRCALELVVCLTNVEGDGRIFLLNRTPPVVPPFATTTGGSTSTATFGASKSAAGEAVGAVTSTSASTPVPAIKFVMLNPSVHFLPLVMEARSVLLLGGTMKPFSYFTSLLFPAVPRERMRLFSCDHVVPAQQVGAVIVPHYEDPVPSSSARSSRVNFEFTYDKRLSTDQTNALFQALIEICANTPGGVVVFCTSFQYLEALLSRWRSSKILYKLDAIKRVFAESRAGCSDTTASSTNSGNTCNNVWEAYKRQVETHPQEGAVLFSVINGKLSEGINFSDELARCVVVVGLPYPDVRDPVLQEKMRYVSAHDTLQVTHGTFAQHLGDAGTCAAGGSGDGNGGGGGGGDKLGCVTVPPVSSQQAGGGVAGAGRKLCENMCMKAVNQSVGRAIRHVHDYACVVLLDRRYMQEQFRSQLPGWILRNIQVCGSGSVNGGGDGQRTLQAHLKSFFASQEKLSK